MSPWLRTQCLGWMYIKPLCFFNIKPFFFVMLKRSFFNDKTVPIQTYSKQALILNNRLCLISK